MSRKMTIIYIVICFMILCIPFAGMPFYKADLSVKKQEAVKFPESKKNGKTNIEFLPELGAYFEDRFAFKDEFISAGNFMSAELFGTSGLGSVIVGKDGWLYYTDSMNDYTCESVLSDRAICNIVNNIMMMQDYAEKQGKKFIFTIAPNKNTLYGEHMPSNILRTGTESNLIKLEKAMKNSDISYVNLREKLSTYDDTLYFKRDSHWNEIGAAIAFNELLDSKSITHENYTDYDYSKKCDYKGDLSAMLYPRIGYYEDRYIIEYEQDYVFTGEFDDVEDSFLTTEKPKGKKGNGSSLLMYRDSFGNALIPYMADTFDRATFSKQQPYLLSMDMKNSKADTIIVEKVERKIDELSSEAPLIAGIQASIKGKGKIQEVYTDTTLNAKVSENLTSFTEISGILDRYWIDDDSPVYIRITDENTGKNVVYQAFLTTNDGNDFGYKLYIDSSKINYENAFIEVIGKQGKKLNVLYEDAISFTDVRGN